MVGKKGLTDMWRSGGSHENEKARVRARSQAAEKALENEKKALKK